MEKVNKDIEITDLVEKYPETVKFLSHKGIKCIACGEPVWGTLEEAAKEKNFSDDEIKQLVSELNAFIQNIN